MAALKIFLRVVLALMRREAVTRSGSSRFGYVWAFMEPAVYIAGFTLFRAFASPSVPFGENAILFLITALLTFRTAMGLTRRTMGAIQANIALLTFPQVKTFDVIAARIMLEAVTWVAITAIFIAGLYFFNGVWAAPMPERFISGFLATLLFGASFGFFNAILVRLFPFWDRILSLVSLPLFLLSGVFFLPSSLPPNVLNLLWWNPYLHLVEWVRSGVYIDYSPYFTPDYVFGLSGLLLVTGLFLNRFYQNRIVND